MAFVICLALGVLSYTAMSGARLVISLYAIELGAQPFAVGMLIATLQVMPLFLSLPVGRLADRFGTRWLMTAGFAGLIAGMLLLAVAPSLSMFFVASGLNGVLLGINNVALQQLAGALSAPAERARNFSNLALTGATGNLLGPLIAGVSIDQLGHGGAGLVMLGVAVAGAATLLAWGARLPQGSGRAAAKSKERRRPPLRDIWQILLVSALVQLCTDVFLFYMPVYGRAIGLSATTIGLVMAAFAVAVFLVRAIMPNLLNRLGEGGLLRYSFFVAGAGFALAPAFTHPGMLALVSFLIGLGAGVGQPLTMMMVVGRSAAGRSGEMLGLQLTANGVIRSGGPVLLGMMGSLIGLGPVFIFSALLMGAGGFLSRRAAEPPATPG